MSIINPLSLFLIGNIATVNGGAKILSSSRFWQNRCRKGVDASISPDNEDTACRDRMGAIRLLFEGAEIRLTAPVPPILLVG